MNGRIGDHADSFPWIAASDDGGDTWKRLGVCGRPPEGDRFSESRIVQLPDSSILCMVRTPQGPYRSSRSTDGGAGWSEMRATGIPCFGSSPADLLLLPDGRLLCTYGNRGIEPRGVRACISEDGGRTWDLGNEFVLRDDAIGRDMGYPSTELLPDGSLLSVYYWHNQDQVRHLQATRWSL